LANLNGYTYVFIEYNSAVPDFCEQLKKGILHYSAYININSNIYNKLHEIYIVGPMVVLEINPDIINLLTHPTLIKNKRMRVRIYDISKATKLPIHPHNVLVEIMDKYTSHNDDDDATRLISDPNTLTMQHIQKVLGDNWNNLVINTIKKILNNRNPDLRLVIEYTGISTPPVSKSIMIGGGTKSMRKSNYNASRKAPGYNTRGNKIKTRKPKKPLELFTISNKSRKNRTV
jgi:hypothetical protein